MGCFDLLAAEAIPADAVGKNDMEVNKLSQKAQ